MRHSDLSDADCAIAQAAGIVGDWWSLLVVRDWPAACTGSTGCRTRWGSAERC